MKNSEHNISRRQVLHGAGALAWAAAAGFGIDALPTEGVNPLIIDTHQHLWDLSKLKLPWAENGTAIYRKSYRTEEYVEATRGLNVKAVYMEVDSPADQRTVEAEYAIGLCRSGKNPTVAAVIGARPDQPDFKEFVARFKATGFLRGIRQVLHSSAAPAGTCLKPDFVHGIQFLGTQELSFDLCLRTTELTDGLKLSRLCPDTRFILDHCGNADPIAFLANPPPGVKPSHDPEAWKRDMAALAKQPNVICKISGIVARAPEVWAPDMLAPIVNHCLDTFGPDRVVFGGDWPICLKRTSLANWIDALKQIVAPRPAVEQRKLWADNAKRLYALGDL